MADKIRKPYKGSIYRKAALLFVVSFALLSALHFALFTWQWRTTDRIVAQRDNWHLAREVLERADRHGIRLDRGERARAFMLDLTHLNPEIAVFLLSAGGELEAHYAITDSDPQPRVDPAPIERFLSAGPADAPILGENPYNGEPVVFSAAPTPSGGYMYVVLETSSGSLRQIMSENALVFGAALASFALFVAVSLVAASLIWLASGRMRSIVDALLQIGRGRLDTRVSVSGDDELSYLANSINQVAAGLERTISALNHKDEERRELVAAVAHDLQGPLSNIKALREKFAGSAVSPDRQRLDAAEERSFRYVERLLGDMMELCRLDSPDLKPEPEAISLPELFDEIELQHLSTAEERQVRLLTSCPQACPPVMGDFVLLQRALNNLVENALRHTPAGGTVELAADPRQEEMLVAVRDSGTGVVASDAPQLMEAFYRAGAGGGRIGLGLSIVRRIAEIHGSRLEFENRDAGGASFHFALPLAPEPVTDISPG